MKDLASRTRSDSDACDYLVESVIANGNAYYAKKGVPSSKCFNYYDVGSPTTCGAEYPPEAPALNDYLHRPDVLKALNLPNETNWTECSVDVENGVYSHKFAPGSVVRIFVSEVFEAKSTNRMWSM